MPSASVERCLKVGGPRPHVLSCASRCRSWPLFPVNVQQLHVRVRRLQNRVSMGLKIVACQKLASPSTLPWPKSQLRGLKAPQVWLLDRFRESTSEPTFLSWDASNLARVLFAGIGSELREVQDAAFGAARKMASKKLCWFVGAPIARVRSAESTTCTQSSEVRARVACSPFHRPRPTCSSAITCEAKWNQLHFISRTKNAAACVFTYVARTLRPAVLAVDAVAEVVCERNMHSLRRKKQSRNESLATSFFLSITPRRSSLGAPSTPLDIFQRPQYGMIHSSVYTL